MDERIIMSRSYKHNHYVKDPNDQYMKKLANQVVRNVPLELTDTLNGGGFKRYFESWDITDHYELSKGEVISFYTLKKRLLTDRDFAELHGWTFLTTYYYFVV